MSELAAEWVKCIRRDATHAWCGRRLWFFDWAFQDAEHWRLYESQGGRLVACEGCQAHAVATTSTP